MGCSKQLSI
ncbi:hypothetical protein LINPERPRIM_LOCUS41677 [Linum perenne]